MQITFCTGFEKFDFPAGAFFGCLVVYHVLLKNFACTSDTLVCLHVLQVAKYPSFPVAHLEKLLTSGFNSPHFLHLLASNLISYDPVTSIGYHEVQHYPLLFVLRLLFIHAVILPYQVKIIN